MKQTMLIFNYHEIKYDAIFKIEYTTYEWQKWYMNNENAVSWFINLFWCSMFWLFSKLDSEYKVSELVT